MQEQKKLNGMSYYPAVIAFLCIVFGQHKSFAAQKTKQAVSSFSFASSGDNASSERDSKKKSKLPTGPADIPLTPSQLNIPLTFTPVAKNVSHAVINAYDKGHKKITEAWFINRENKKLYRCAEATTKSQQFFEHAARDEKGMPIDGFKDIATSTACDVENVLNVGLTASLDQKPGSCIVAAIGTDGRPYLYKRKTETWKNISFDETLKFSHIAVGWKPYTKTHSCLHVCIANDGKTALYEGGQPVEDSANAIAYWLPAIWAIEEETKNIYALSISISEELIQKKKVFTPAFSWSLLQTGGAKRIAVGNDGLVLAINEAGAVAQFIDGDSPWTLLPGDKKIQQVAVADADHILGIANNNDQHVLYCYRRQTQSWIPIQGRDGKALSAFKHIGVNATSRSKQNGSIAGFGGIIGIDDNHNGYLRLASDDSKVVQTAVAQGTSAAIGQQSTTAAPITNRTPGGKNYRAVKNSRRWAPASWRFNSKDRGYVAFSARGAFELEVLLANNSIESKVPAYAVLIGGGANSRVSLQMNGRLVADPSKNSDQLMYVDKTSQMLLDSKTFKPFWIAFNQGIISFGSALDKDGIPLIDKRLFQWTISGSSIQNIQYFTFGSSGGDIELKDIRSGDLPGSQMAQKPAVASTLPTASSQSAPQVVTPKTSSAQASQPAKKTNVVPSRSKRGTRR